jgi:acetyl esterase/lipase
MEKLKILPPFFGPPDKFPEAHELPDGARAVTLTDRPGPSMLNFNFNVVYDTRDGEELHLQIIAPMPDMFSFGAPPKKYPLIMYIQGSAWQRQFVYQSLPSLTRVAERGYAVAMVQYRPSDVASFPAQIEDTKTAIRFMRKNAAQYGIDPDKIAVWGDSSGGHTAVMTGITGDNELSNGQYGEFSAKVSCIVDWFGATDITLMNHYPSGMDHNGPDSPEGMLLGKVPVQENLDKAAKAIPMNYLSRERDIPPILIMHGSRDNLVPFNQSVRLYEKLRELNKTVEFVKLIGGGHGDGGFRSDAALDIVLDFASKYIG